MNCVDETIKVETKTHIPVMLNEVIEHLQPRQGQVFVDGTLGMGGHAEVILKLIGPAGRLIGIDQDVEVLEAARKVFEGREGRYDFVHENFRHIVRILDGLGISAVDGILLDLGLSSFQLDDPRRGFGFRNEGPLDMRMNQMSPTSAYDLINSLSENEISSLLKNFGQERWHARIARSIVHMRTEKPIETTAELSRAVLRAMPRFAKRQKIHPATRTFQALRIAVNNELDGLDETLSKCIGRLRPGGRIAVISFHSLEDRIVKQTFRNLAKNGVVTLITKKPLRPSEGETQTNPRARSARLRIAERN